MDYLLSFITIIVCIGINLAFRRSDRNNKTIEKVKRWGEKVQGDLGAFVDDKTKSLTEISLELQSQQSRAIATIKRLDQTYTDITTRAASLEKRLAVIEGVERYVRQSEHTIQKLMDMTALAEKNLTQISQEADFVDSLARSIENAKYELNEIANAIPEMQNRFAQESQAQLQNHKEKILSDMSRIVYDMELRLESVQKSSSNLLESASRKLEEIYKNAMSEAAQRADKLEEEAFEKLKAEASERAEMYKKALEEQSNKLTDEIKAGFADVKAYSQTFQQNWQSEISGFAENLKTDLLKVKDDTAAHVHDYKQVLEDHTEKFEAGVKSSIAEAKTNTENFKKEWQIQLGIFADSIKSGLNKIKEDAGLQAQDYKKSLEENSAKFKEDIKLSIEEAKREAEGFKKEWQTELTVFSGDVRADLIKIKDEASIQMQSYQKSLEENTGKFEGDIKRNIEETENSIENFKKDWQIRLGTMEEALKTEFAEAEKSINSKTDALFEKINSSGNSISANLESLKAGFIKTEDEINSRTQALFEKINRSEDKMTLSIDSLKTDLDQTSSSIKAQFDSLTADMQEKLLNFSKYSDKKFTELKQQSDSRFLKFDALISGVDTLQNELEKSQTGIQERVLREFTQHTDGLKQQYRSFLQNFTGEAAKISERMQVINSDIDELKRTAHANVSEQLQTFQDSFFADLTKRSENISLSFEQMKNDISEKLTLMASEYESNRKDLEYQYTQDLKNRISQTAEEYKTQFEKLGQKVEEAQAAIMTKIEEADKAISGYSEGIKDEVNSAKEKAANYVEEELINCKQQFQENIAAQNRAAADEVESLKKMLASIKEEAGIEIEGVKAGFELWKSKTEQQFADVRTLFDDKVNNAANLTENAIKNLDLKYNSQYSDFITRGDEAFAALQAKIGDIDAKITAANGQLDSHALEVSNRFNSECAVVKEDLDKKLKEAEGYAKKTEQNIQELIHEVKVNLDKMQEKMRDKIQTETNRLTEKVEEIDKKQNAFIVQTKIFDRADELKTNLENDIEKLKTEVTHFEVYKKAIEDLTLECKKVSFMENEASQKIARFMDERKHIDIIEGEFAKLAALSESMDRKVVELTGVNDDLQQYQVQIRKIEESITDVNTRYDRLEKKGIVLDQTVESIDTAFENLKSIESNIKTCKTDLTVIPAEIEQIKESIDLLTANKDNAEDVYRKISQMDSLLEDMDTKIKNLQNAREWLAATETRLKEISKNSEAQLKLMSDLFAGGGKIEKAEKTGFSISTRENVLKLSRQNWSIEQIANALNLSYGEVQLILELAEK